MKLKEKKCRKNDVLNQEVTLKLNRTTSEIIIQQPQAIKYASKSANSTSKKGNDEIRRKSTQNRTRLRVMSQEITTKTHTHIILS